MCQAPLPATLAILAILEKIGMEKSADEKALDDGVVYIKLGDEEIGLTACEDAASRIERVFGGLRPAFDAIPNYNRQQWANIIAAGAGMKPKKANLLPGKIYKAGMSGLLAPLQKYLLMLMQGGTLPDLDDEEDESAEGNG